jgi:hypothetical protein
MILMQFLNAEQTAQKIPIFDALGFHANQITNTTKVLFINETFEGINFAF